MEIRARISYFTAQLALISPSRRLRPNLLPTQVEGLEYLRNHPTYIVWPSDKNLGPVLTTRDTYREKAYDHLNDTTTYRELSMQDAKSRLRSIEIITRNFVTAHHTISKPNRYGRGTQEAPSKTGAYILDAFNDPKPDPFSKFYITAKVHKDPWSSRPITSYAGSTLYNLGVWLDRQLQKIVSSLEYVAKSSSAVATDLRSKGPFPPGTRLFTMDAVSMYTNIDTQHALREISAFLNSPYFDNTACDIDSSAVTDALRIIMVHSVFSFDNRYYLQLTGTAMGAPPAPMYATLYFYVHERNVIPQTAPHLHYYTRYIDDGFGIWIPHLDPDEDDKLWTQFKSDINTFGKLEWICSARGTSVNFLDIVITVKDNNCIHTTLFEKDLNLYLYIPPMSAHTPRLLTSLVRGHFYRLARLCSDQTDRRQRITALYTRLLRRGYTAPILRHVFTSSASIFDPPPSVIPAQPDPPLFLHATYQPPDNRQDIRRLFQITFVSPPREPIITAITGRLNKPLFDPFRFVICYHRLPNLKNILCPRRVLSLTPQNDAPPNNVSENDGLPPNPRQI